MIRYDSLLQNTTDIIAKCDSYFTAKWDRSLLQNASGFLLENATVITKCNNFITKYVSYYKIRRLLQIVTVHLFRTLSNAFYENRAVDNFRKLTILDV